MRNPFAPYTTVYQHDKRQHRHRCVACHCVLNAGDNALMIRAGKGTKAVHADCADKEWPQPAGWTWRKQFEAWGDRG